MKKGKFAKHGHRGAANKTLALILSMVLIVGCVAGGTLAWLLDDTGPVTNEFTNSNIDVDLGETEQTYKMIPGWTINKDPKASVTSTSEDCYLFVEVTKSENFDTYMAYAIDSQWTKLSENGLTAVYYIEIDESGEKGVEFNILGEGKYSFKGVDYTWTDNQVLTKPEVTKTMMETAASSKPTLTFSAYAVQLWQNNTTRFEPADAWELAK